MRRSRTVPSLAIDFCGAILVVVALTLMVEMLLYWMLKERSSMHLYSRVLCGIMATGDIFSCGGSACLMEPYVTIFAYPPLTFSCASAINAARAAGIFAEICGPRMIAASICCCDQLEPQFTGQP